MEASVANVKVPFSKRVIATAAAGLVAIGLSKIVPGYHPDPSVQSLIDLAIAGFAGWAVTEEETYLKLALAKIQGK